MLIAAGELLGTHSSHCYEHDGDQHHEHVLDGKETEYFLADQIKVNFGAHEIQHEADEQLRVGGNEREKVQLAVVLASLLPFGISGKNRRDQKS